MLIAGIHITKLVFLSCCFLSFHFQHKPLMEAATDCLCCKKQAIFPERFSPLNEIPKKIAKVSMAKGILIWCFWDIFAQRSH